MSNDKKTEIKAIIDRTKQGLLDKICLSSKDKEIFSIYFVRNNKEKKDLYKVVVETSQHLTVYSSGYLESKVASRIAGVAYEYLVNTYCSCDIDFRVDSEMRGRDIEADDEAIERLLEAQEDAENEDMED